MEEKLVFVSVGGTATVEQESFVRSIEDRLRSESLIPKTVGRNTFSADAPLKAITELMEKCSGIVVIALERSYFPSGLERRGGPRQARVARLLGDPAVTVVAMDELEARAVGLLCGRSGHSDVVDVHVALVARDRDSTVVTSDPDDLRHVDPAVSLIVV